MQYQISYFSPNGHGETLVNGFCQILPLDTHVSNLEDDIGGIKIGIRLASEIQ